MRLSELAPEFPRLGPATDPEIAGLTEDSRRVVPGALFVAVRGTSLDGHRFVDEAIRRGAAAVMVEDPPPIGEAAAVPILVARSTRSGLATLAARFVGHPARALRLIGFTGTFGKTTTSEVLRALLDAAGHHAAVLGSLGARYGSFTDPGPGLTTPAPVELHATLRRLRDMGARTVIMEVTTHAMTLGRIEGLALADGLLAAIMPGEHTDYHRSYEDYVAAKRRFLEYLSADATLAYDRDNAAARAIAGDAAVRRTAGLSVGLRAPDRSADLTLMDVAIDERGALMTARGKRLRSALLGRPNVRNVGLALTLALTLDVDLGRARETLGALRPVRRRMERLHMAGRSVVDDTAGHPDSLQAAFEVADLLPHGHLIAAYAVRGNRGADINRRNALALADLTALHDARPAILTASADAAKGIDRPGDAEIDAVRAAFHERGRSFVWHDTLAAAMADAARRSSPGDLILLLGAQGMDRGAELLEAELRC